MGKKTHPSEWNMETSKRERNLKGEQTTKFLQTFALPGCFPSIGKHLDARQRCEDDRIVAQRGRASEPCVLCVEELCDQSIYIALGKTKRDDRSGEKQTKSQCGGQAPRQGQNGGSVFSFPPLLFAPSSPFFSAKKQKTEFGIFFCTGHVSGVWRSLFFFSSHRFANNFMNLKQVEGVFDRSVSVATSF